MEAHSGSTASNCWEDGHNVAVARTGLDALEIPDVFIVEVNIHESVKGTVLGNELIGEARKLLDELIEDLFERSRIRLDRFCSTDMGPKDSWDFYVDHFIQDITSSTSSISPDSSFQSCLWIRYPLAWGASFIKETIR